ncbi:winged helix-turn-helix transcriptional regulator [Caproicibacterium sp. NSD3]
MKKDKEKKKKRSREETAPSKSSKDLKKQAVQQEKQPAVSPKEEEKVSETADNADSLLALALSKVGGKWKLRILLALESSAQDALRYGEIKNTVSGITDMMLSQSLRELTADGLIERRQYQEIPPKVEYRLSPSAKGALPAAQQMAEWAKTF